MSKINTGNRGFTLIELLVVISIIATLSVVVLVALKPAQRLADTRDARRGQDINQILTAVHSCALDKKDTQSLTTCLGTHTVGDTYEIVDGNITTGCDNTCTTATSDTHCLNVSTTLTDYFVDIPKDPNITTTGHTAYSLTQYSNGMIVIEACGAENGTVKASR